MTRNFYIDNIKDPDQLNRLTLLLTDMEEVSHIKIIKKSINFECVYPENVQEALQEAGEEVILREMINSRKRKYVAPVKKVEHIFMFTNLETQEEANEIEEVLSHYSSYEDVSVDFTNKLLKVTTSDKNVLVRLNRLVDKVNPNIDVEQWKKPFKSQDLFEERFLSRMLRFCGLLVALALGIVTQQDPSILTNLAWLMALIIFNESMIRQAIKDIQVKHFLSENIIMNIACFLGWVYGAYVEMLIVSLIFQLGERFTMNLISYTLHKIDNKIDPVQLGRREIKKGETELVPLEDIDLEDIIEVRPGETIPLGGKVITGKSTLDMFAINGSDEPVEVGARKEVQSGSINLTDTLRIRVKFTYEKSALNKVMEIATSAPVEDTKSDEVVNRISQLYTLALVLAGIICAVVLPIMNMQTNMRYMYMGIIFLSISGSFVYKQVSSFSILSAVAKAFSKNIIISENRGLDNLTSCKTIIYDRFDGVEVTPEELDLFKKLSKLKRKLIIFNDGPVDLENSQYQIYNNLTIDEKLVVLERESSLGNVAYIGDNSKDVSLLQKSHVGISRGGIKDKKVIEHSDIMLMDSDLNNIIEMFNISKKQRNNIVENTLGAFILNAIMIVATFYSMIPWTLATLIFTIEVGVILLNSYRIMDMK